jgi:nucleoside phosphorylase
LSLSTPPSPRSAHADVLVLAAFDPELRFLRGALGDRLQVRVATRVAGIGLPASAAKSALHLREIRPRLCVLVGSCGGYTGAGVRIGTPVVARRIHLVEPCSLPGLGSLTQLPAPLGVAVETHDEVARALADAAGTAGDVATTDVATTLGVTVDDGAAAEISRATGAGVEHMEAFGVATACAALAVPFVAVLGVANIVGATARQEWRDNHDAAEEAAGRVVLRWLEQGARALPPAE